MIHYIIARRDLNPDLVANRTGNPDPPTGVSLLGITAAQVTHAAGESFAAWMEAHVRMHRHARPREINFEVPKHTTAVVLGVPNERALKALEKKLKQACINHVAVREPDYPWNGQLMTIGLWPVMGRGIEQNFLKRLKLL